MHRMSPVARQLLDLNPGVIALEAGTRHWKVKVGGELVGILPYAHRAEGLSCNLAAQFRRAGLRTP